MNLVIKRISFKKNVSNEQPNFIYKRNIVKYLLVRCCYLYKYDTYVKELTDAMRFPDKIHDICFVVETRSLVQEVCCVCFILIKLVI